MNKIKEYRKRRYARLMVRADAADDDEDRWITTENGHKVHLNEEGVPDKGNPHVIEAMTAEKTSKGHKVTMNEKAGSIFEKYKDNPTLFGESWSDQERIKKDFAEELKKSGGIVKPNDYGGYTAIIPEASYAENVSVNGILQQSRFASVPIEDYIDACKKAGVQPQLHRSPDEWGEYDLMTPSGKSITDGTPVYGVYGKEQALSNEELLSYSGFDRRVNPEGYEQSEKAAQQAIDGMTDQEKNAIHQYTKQWGPGTYMTVNKYLATGEGDDKTAKAAELVTSALDHDIGVDCIVSRGDDMIYGTGNDTAIEKLVQKVARGNFTSAKKLRDALVGITVDVPTALSTSPGDSLQGFNQRPVQFIFKTPSNAKGVRIDRLSAFGGGRSEAEKKLAATGLFGAVSTESEVLFRPGLRYSIDDVNFVFSRDKKKKSGQVVITATILGGNE